MFARDGARNMTNPIKILICDDNIAVHESLSAYLNAENMITVSAYDGEQAQILLNKETFDFIILDVMMPKIFGTDLCREIRKTSEVPIMMLSARGEEFDRILGLELGADDYMTKPFSPREVVARIRTILKRIRPQNVNLASQKIVELGHMLIDIEGYLVTINEKPIDLTPKEIELLIYMSHNKNKVLSREQILNKVWGYDYFGDTRSVDTLIKRLRQKLPEVGNGFEIKAIYGVGYKIEVSS